MNKLTPEQIQALADAQNLIASVQRQIEMRIPEDRTGKAFGKMTRDQFYDWKRSEKLGEAYKNLNLILNCDSL